MAAIMSAQPAMAPQPIAPQPMSSVMPQAMPAMHASTAVHPPVVPSQQMPSPPPHESRYIQKLHGTPKAKTTSVAMTPAGPVPLVEKKKENPMDKCCVVT